MLALLQGVSMPVEQLSACLALVNKNSDHWQYYTKHPPVVLPRKASVVVSDQMCFFLPSRQPISRQRLTSSLKLCLVTNKKHESQLLEHFQKLPFNWDFHARPSLGRTENGPKNRKHLVDARGQTCFGMRVRQHRLKWEVFTTEVCTKQTGEADGWRRHGPQWVPSTDKRKIEPTGRTLIISYNYFFIY